VKAEPRNVKALNGVGLYQYEVNNLDAAIASFTKCIEIDRTFLAPYNNLAVTLERKGRKKDGIAWLEKALAIDPNYEDAKKNLARMKAGSR